MNIEQLQKEIQRLKEIPMRSSDIWRAWKYNENNDCDTKSISAAITGFIAYLYKDNLTKSALSLSMTAYNYNNVIQEFTVADLLHTANTLYKTEEGTVKYYYQLGFILRSEPYNQCFNIDPIVYGAFWRSVSEYIVPYYGRRI